jgi:23S rRNA pseudouridine2604 synthase
MAGLRILQMKRIRVGRLPLAGLEVGEWRFMAPGERV